MEWKWFFTVFATVFLAEMADKTQLATMLFASDREVSGWTVFAGSASALVVSAGIAVVAGSWLSQWLDPRWLAVLAGVGFIAIGGWTLYHGLIPSN